MTNSAQNSSVQFHQAIAHRRPSASDTAPPKKVQLNPQPNERSPREYTQRRKSATVLESYLV